MGHDDTLAYGSGHGKNVKRPLSTLLCWSRRHVDYVYLAAVAAVAALSWLAWKQQPREEASALAELGAMAEQVIPGLPRFGVSNEAKHHTFASIHPLIPYRLSEPSRRYRLPMELEEVSGLAVDPSGKRAWMIADEQGVIVEMNLVQGTVVGRDTFAGAGDFEGLTLAGDILIALRSDGTLWFLERGEERYKTKPFAKLGRKLDELEGIAWDHVHKRLLVAGKGRARSLNGKKLAKHLKAIYPLALALHDDVQTLTNKPPPLRLLPPLQLSQRQLARFLNTDHGSQKLGEKKRAAKAFAPSALAVEPASGHLVVLSSTGRMLVVVNPHDGRFLAAAPLTRKVHAQPEGLAFDARGGMYIANEGRGGQAWLYRFDPLFK